MIELRRTLFLFQHLALNNGADSQFNIAGGTIPEIRVNGLLELSVAVRNKYPGSEVAAILTLRKPTSVAFDSARGEFDLKKCYT